ncbi:MAG: site-2 protease family protein [Clostridia bacterium]|jgi:stage IV sporulation protein FB|nr:site-2 protease family protein [Clostridia bacterium]
MKKFGLHPLFILLGLLFIVTGFGILFLIYLIVVILHELTHAFVAKRLGYKINKIFLLPFGAQLSLDQNFMEAKDEVYVALAGPLCNFFLAFLCIAIWWIEPVIFNYTKEFVFANFINGLINLMPCYPMDGGRIFVALLSKNLERKKALRFCFLFNYVVSLIFIILFFINLKFGVNITFALMAIFIFFGTIENKLGGNYVLKNIPFSEFRSNNTKNIPVNIFAVRSDIEIFKIAKYLSQNKYNIIYIISPDENIKIISQKIIKKLLLKYPLKTRLNEIYNI